MRLTSSVYSNIEPYKPFDKGLNGINTPTPHTVLKSSGINRSKQPYSSGIYSVSMEVPKKEGDIFAIEKGDIQKTPKEFPKNKVTFRRYRRLHTHKITILLEAKQLDINTVSQDLVRLLNLNPKTKKHTTGEDYETWVYKEKNRGETLTITFIYKTKTYFIRIDTHKTFRADTLLDYAYRVLKISTIRLLQLETYVRYLERYELKIAKTLEALDVELGKGIKEHKIPNEGKHDYYLCRAKLEYKGAEVDVKTYRSKYYRKHAPTEAEYHPKLEQMTELRQIPLPIRSVKDIMKEYATLLYTIAWTINPRIVLGEYEINETETIEVYAIDKQIQKYIRGITKRIKAEVILEEQVSDKRIAIAKLLVEKKMKITEITKLMGYSKRHTLRIIEELVNTGVIKRVKRGVYEWNNKNAKLEKQRIVESRQMTLQQAIQFIRENKAHIVNSRGTLAVEYEDEYTIRRIIISNIIIEEDRIVERIAGRKLIYTIPRNRLRQLIIA